jgi:hypothetical protein
MLILEKDNFSQSKPFQKFYCQLSVLVNTQFTIGLPFLKEYVPTIFLATFFVLSVGWFDILLLFLG